MGYLSPKRLHGGGLGKGESSFTGDPGSLVVGHLSARDSMKGTLREGSFTENPKDEDFERYAKCPVNGPLSS
jgi:hypothetical protein